MSYVTSVICL